MISVGGTGPLAACGPVAGSTSPAAVTTQISQAATAAQPPACLAGTCYVAVSVATVWVKPWYPRSVDRQALGAPAYPGTWVRKLTVTQKIWLVGKLETQALYGTKVIVTGHWRNWTHVAIPSQPTNRDRRGYPGWIPTAQLTRTAPRAAKTSAVVRTSAAWLWSGWTANGVAGRKLLLASYDTGLPVVQATPAYVEVTMIGGQAGGRPSQRRKTPRRRHIVGRNPGEARRRSQEVPRSGLPVGWNLRVRFRLLRIHILRLPSLRGDFGTGR